MKIWIFNLFFVSLSANLIYLTGLSKTIKMNNACTSWRVDFMVDCLSFILFSEEGLVNRNPLA